MYLDCKRHHVYLDYDRHEYLNHSDCKHEYLNYNDCIHEYLNYNDCNHEYLNYNDCDRPSDPPDPPFSIVS